MALVKVYSSQALTRPLAFQTNLSDMPVALAYFLALGTVVALDSLFVSRLEGGANDMGSLRAFKIVIIYVAQCWNRGQHQCNITRNLHRQGEQVSLKSECLYMSKWVTSLSLCVSG